MSRVESPRNGSSLSIKSFRITAIISVSVLTACSDSQKFSFSGSDGEFCVPNEYVIDDPIWLTRDIVPDNGGVAWRGCGYSYRGACDMPSEVDGGVLGPLANLRWSTWGELPAGTVPREVTLRSLEDHTYRILPDGSEESTRILATPTKETKTGVYYWRISKTGEPSLGASSPLLAECDGVKEHQSTSDDEVAFQCSRSVRMHGMGLSYRFASGTITSRFVEALDQQVYSGIERWRCKR